MLQKRNRSGRWSGWPEKRLGISGIQTVLNSARSRPWFWSICRIWRIKGIHGTLMLRKGKADLLRGSILSSAQSYGMPLKAIWGYFFLRYFSLIIAFFVRMMHAMWLYIHGKLQLITHVVLELTRSGRWWRLYAGPVADRRRLWWCMWLDSSMGS